MSISASNYMSNASILAWMETRTDDIYGKMRDSMDSSNTRAHAEDELNTIKGKLNDLKLSNGDAEEVRQEINAAIDQYKDVPEIAQVLQPIADELDSAHQTMLKNQAEVKRLQPLIPQHSSVNLLLNKQLADAKAGAGPVRITADQAESWSKQLQDKVDILGKQDQLGMINIQEFNAQLNQAKQTASALMDAADKSASSIISHIS